MAAASPTATSPFGPLARNWGWLLALGIAFIVLGTIGLGRLYAVTLAGVLFFGVLILIGGAVQLVQAFQCRGWKAFLWHVLLALLHVTAGIVVVSDPLLASEFLTLFLAFSFVAMGAVRIVMALQMRGTRGSGWALVSGIAELLLGVVVAIKWPVSGLFVIGLFIAVELVLHGWTYVLLAFAARDAGRSGTAAA